MDAPLLGRTVLVTGSTRNLGRACAVRFAELGAHVVVNGTSPDGGRATVAECAETAGTAIYVQGDVSDADDVDALVSESERQLGPIDTYISAVAIRRDELFEDITLESWDAVLRTNLTASFLLAQRIIPGMRERGFGRVVHIIGEEAWVGAPKRAHNIAAKAGLHGLTKALATEVAGTGVTVNSVSPGGMSTTRNPSTFPDWDDAEQAALVPVGRLGAPAEIAALCAYVASEEAAFLTGQVVHLNGGRWMF